MTPLPPGAKIYLHQAFKCCPYAGTVSSRVHDYLHANGFVVVDRPGGADAHVVNTCGSDARQAQLTWDALAALRPTGKPVVALGCLASIEPRRLDTELSGLEALKVDPRHHDRLDAWFGPRVAFADVPPSLHNAYRGNDFAEGWAHVVASTGCLGECAFCAIRRATGRPKSRQIAEILGDIDRAVRAGQHDILLVSTDLSAWGHDSGQTVVDLVRAVVEAPGEFLASGESFEPTLFLHHFDALLPLFASGKFAFLGIPIQSGSPRVLRAMGRSYDPAAVVNAVSRLKTVAPGVVTRTDILYGFGDETDEDFEASLRASRAFDLPSFNAYQARPGTAPVQLDADTFRLRGEQGLAEMQARAQAGLPSLRRWGGATARPGLGRAHAHAGSIDQAALRAEFGPLDLVGAHAGVHVYRRRDASFDGRFIKIHDEPARAERERAVLGLDLGFVAPRVHPGAGATLVLDDVRQGHPRPLRLRPDQLPAAGAILGRLHRQCLHLGASAMDWVQRTRLRVSQQELPAELRQAFASLVLVGDATCHLDLHPSNWVTRGPELVGLLDFGAVGWADPEIDLAQAIHGAGGDPRGIDPIAAAWEAVTGRDADRPRIGLYLWLLHAERRLAKGEASPWEAACTPSRPAHGQDRYPRAFPKTEWTGAWRPEDGLWHPLDGVDLGALGLGAVATASYQRHACNDVVRVRLGEREAVLKVFNKPVPGRLFELERAVDQRLQGTPAVVESPLVLPDGRSILRVGPRMAALYPYLGDARPSSSARDIERLAHALAAFHTIGDLRLEFPEIDHRDEDLPWATLQPFDTPGLREAWDWATAGVATELPRGLVHGSFHRDHAVSLGDGRIAVLDLEKLRVSPLLLDLGRSAVYAGYRGNDEQADPRRVIHFVRCYDAKRRLEPSERAALVPAIVLALLRDVKALGQEGASAEAQARHAAVVREFFHNRENLRSVMPA
ncbi:MAG: phosphotransferase [Deltaproteobacteria bacterium]|nr:phosphotransferase [Deltaproteobacteria bacterium]